MIEAAAPCAKVVVVGVALLARVLVVPWLGRCDLRPRAPITLLVGRFPKSMPAIVVNMIGYAR